ncbi:VRR-NUC domain-containing protein [Acidisoma cladoniae]|jgi:hypothetical protein|uniref:VRR-NUC domain-containing protein n=1 Tax=Acidisoma cladoniae TaxID=3040935 RepID=UPI00254FEEA3|nr:VRR-NUC domain-containing protein [Acidisoma sp. PAMC 29798]
MPLDPVYYVDDFGQVIAGVRARYGFLLNGAEQRHLATLDGLGPTARMLYARLVNRKGPCFRVARLTYPEIGSLSAALAELLAEGLVEPCDDAMDPDARARLYACFTHAELKASLRPHAPAGPRKDALLTWLSAWDGCDAWLMAFLRAHEVVRIPERDPWAFLRFLFFGDLRDNLSDFVTRALGHIVTETVEPARLRAHFQTRGAADDAYRMAMLYAAFRSRRDRQPAVATLAWWQAQAVDRAALSAGASTVDRLVDRLGRLLEREGEMDAALALYATCPVAPARERRARLLIKRGRRDEALSVLGAMAESPCHAEEDYVARHLLARLEKKSRRSEARHYQQTSDCLVIDYPDGAVEAAVLAHYHAAGWQGVHSENWLWNAAFGLLLWDVIYDPDIGVFHSPLQFAPSDLHEPVFYERRRGAIEARLALLADPGAAHAVMIGHFDAKLGIANPFVHWHEDLPRLLGILVDRLPPHGLAEVLRRIGRDIKRHARGLPDLFLWTDDSYRFVEIKAENDHLSPHQYQWLRYFADSDIRVSLEKIARPRGGVSCLTASAL